MAALRRSMVLSPRRFDPSVSLFRALAQKPISRLGDEEGDEEAGGGLWRALEHAAEQARPMDT
jgi:hypothetical protein